MYLVSVSSGPSGNRAKLMITQDGGKRWTDVEGLPSQINDNINTYQLDVGKNGSGHVLINNSSVYLTEDFGQSWSKHIDYLPKTYQVLNEN
jgi:photosystem II stability/assembly factor-like uncharacterized protein